MAASHSLVVARYYWRTNSGVMAVVLMEIGLFISAMQIKNADEAGTFLIFPGLSCFSF
ncbi:MAG: hypothetical protein ACRERR_12765 [Moraxellaceae bacterium]